MSQDWITIDATDKVFGRLATAIAHQLQGKDKPSYSTHLVQAPHIVVTNCAKLKIGQRLSIGKYYSHSGYLGNLKENTFKDQTNSQRLEKAVSHMLPDNKNRKILIKHLHCIEETDHPHKAQTNE